MQIFYILIWKERTAGLGNIFPGQFMIVATIEKGARIPRPKENMATASGNATSTVLTEKDGNERRFPLFCAKSPTCWSIHCRKTTKMWHSLESGSTWKLFVSIVEAFKHFEISRHMPLRIHLNFTFDLLVQTRFPIQKKTDIRRCTKPYSPPDREI